MEDWKLRFFPFLLAITYIGSCDDGDKAENGKGEGMLELSARLEQPEADMVTGIVNFLPRHVLLV